MIIKGEKLIDIIDTAMKLRLRSASKAKHKEALRRGSTVALELLPEAVQDKIVETWHMEHNPKSAVVSMSTKQDHKNMNETPKRTHTPSFVAALHTAHDLTTDPKLHRRHGSFTLTPSTLPANNSSEIPHIREEHPHVISHIGAGELHDDCDEATPFPSSTSKVLFQQHVAKTLEQLQHILKEPMEPMTELKEQLSPSRSRFAMTSSSCEEALYVQPASNPNRRRASTIRPSNELQLSPSTSTLERNEHCEDTAASRSHCGSVLADSANYAVAEVSKSPCETLSSLAMQITSSGSTVGSKPPISAEKTIRANYATSDVISGAALQSSRKLNDSPSRNGIAPARSPGHSTAASPALHSVNGSKSKDKKFQAAEYRKLQEPTYLRYDAIMQHIGDCDKRKLSSQTTSKLESKRQVKLFSFYFESLPLLQYELYVAKQQNVNKDPVLNFLVHREAIAKKK